MTDDHVPVIRPASDHDNQGLVALAEAVWPAAYAFADPALARHTIDVWWSPEANTRSLVNTTVLVADVSGEVVGMGNIDTRRDVPMIWKLAVHPRFQGTGTGFRLIQALLQHAPDRPVRLAYVDGNVPAERFYTALGFTPVGTNGPERDGWPGEVVVELAPDATSRPRPGQE